MTRPVRSASCVTPFTPIAPAVTALPITLTAIARLTTLQATQTRDAATDAQLRQLLLAGQAYIEPKIEIAAEQLTFTPPQDALPITFRHREGRRIPAVSNSLI